MNLKTKQLIEIYNDMSKEQINEETEAFFDIGFALLEHGELDSIEMYPNPSIKLKFSCEVLRNDDEKYYC